METIKDRDSLARDLLKVREGSDTAFAELLGRYKPLVESVVRGFSSDELSRADEDDLRQVATVVFYNAILSYDLEQSEVSFGLYAKICITNALLSELRAIGRRRAQQGGEDRLWTEPVSEEPAKRLLEEERLRELYTLIRNNLSGFENRVWHLYMAGKTAREIGEIVGRDEKSVSNAIYRIRKKLRSCISR